MKNLDQEAAGSVRSVKGALSRPAREAGADVSEGFRAARSALGQITTDLERLRRHAASLVKATHRPAK